MGTKKTDAGMADLEAPPLRSDTNSTVQSSGEFIMGDTASDKEMDVVKRGKEVYAYTCTCRSCTSWPFPCPVMCDITQQAAHTTRRQGTAHIGWR